MGRVLIENGYVVTVDPQRRVYPDGFVLINGNKIEAVGNSAQTPTRDVARTIDASGMIVIPGLINAHQHFYYHLFKGLGHGLLLEDWFPHLVFPVLPHLTDDDMELTSYLAAIEMLSTGTTCCLNHLRTTTSEELLQRISAPTAELGFRQVIGKEVQCRLAGNPRHPRDLADEIAYVEDLIPRWKHTHDGLTRLCLVAECTSVFVEHKLTSEELLIGINCTPTDLRLIANSGASLIYCPTSEAVRGGGIGPAAAALAVGVNVALGSDGPMVDDSVDMLEQMKACSFLQGVKHLDPTIMPPERCIEMATINAARAMGLDDEIGSLEVGKLADVAIFDLDTPHSTPATNPVASLVYSARGPDAHTVFVEGREVVTNHKLTTFSDTKHLFARARARTQEIVTKPACSTGRHRPGPSRFRS